MDKLEKTIVSGFTGTTFMTAASALMSLLPHENFKEPEHLANMVGRLAPFLSKKSKTLAGISFAHQSPQLIFYSL